MVYQLCKDVMNHQIRRGAFNRLSGETFNLSFENWYQSGYWSERNIPYVLFDGERAVAGISVNRMDILWEGKIHPMIQLGTVMTDKAYRKQGLSRLLMEEIMAEWKEQCEAVFLFANRSVLDFYPKFGFRKYAQYSYRMLFEGQNGDAVKLDSDCESDREVMKSCYDNGNPFSRIQEVNNFGLLMFYCLAPMKHMIYYSPSCDAVVIAEQKGKEFHCYDIFCCKGHDLGRVLATAAAPQTEQVVFHFTPEECGDGMAVQLSEGNDTLFVYPDSVRIFADHKLLFPEMSHT